jgi:membrane-associated phospholipid phosphatase
VRVSEWLSIAYGVYVAIVAAFRADWRGRRTAWPCAAIMIGLPIGFAYSGSVPLRLAVRDWAPALYILVSYYATGALFGSPSARFEAWLRRADAWLLGGWRADALPAAISTLVEVLYTGTFLMIPAGFAMLAAAGGRAAADRYWTMVSAAEYVSFGVLPWLPSRPPWVVERLEPRQESGVRRFGLAWVRRTSHHANTFPSGHTAGSLAVAFAVLPFAPLVGLSLLVVAIGIAVGCVSGRYHYAVDVVAGVGVALVVWAVVAAAGL